MINNLKASLGQLRYALRSFARNQRGATATEYGILVGFMALAMVLGVTAFGQALNTRYQGLTAAISAALGIP